MISNKILKQQLEAQILNDANVNKEFDRIAREQFMLAKQKMLKEFDSHQVTKELENFGESKLIPRGTLFGFLGFDKGDDPVAPLRDLLDRATILKPGRIRRGRAQKSYAVTIPTKEELYSATPLPWAPGRSWLKAVEFGISGLGNYMAIETDRSRSGEGIQVKNANLGGKFKNIQYLSSILKNMEKNLLTLGITIK